MLGGENPNYFFLNPNPYRFDLNVSPQLPTTSNVNSSQWFQQQQGTRQEPANNDLRALSLGTHKSNSPDCNLQLGGRNWTQNQNLKTAGISTSLGLNFPEDQHDHRAGMTSTSQEFSPDYYDLWGIFARPDKDTNKYMQQKEAEWHRELQKIRVHHTTCMANTIQRHCQQNITQKNVELEKMYAKNQKLMENINKMKAEVEHWRFRAEESEIQRINLQTELERARKEECGGNDALSSVTGGIDGSLARRCVVCKREEARILHLPCHQLSVCVVCDRSIFACPVCSSRKTQSIEVNFP